MQVKDKLYIIITRCGLFLVSVIALVLDGMVRSSKVWRQTLYSTHTGWFVAHLSLDFASLTSSLPIFLKRSVLAGVSVWSVFLFWGTVLRPRPS